MADSDNADLDSPNWGDKELILGQRRDRIRTLTVLSPSLLAQNNCLVLALVSETRARGTRVVHIKFHLQASSVDLHGFTIMKEICIAMISLRVPGQMPIADSHIGIWLSKNVSDLNNMPRIRLL